MAEALKVLGQQDPAAATLTDLYAVPLAASATVSSVTVCNRGTATTFRVSVAIAAAADTPAQYIYWDTELPANDTFIATVGLTLGALDVLRCYSPSNDVSFNAFGVEVT